MLGRQIPRALKYQIHLLPQLRERKAFLSAYVLRKKYISRTLAKKGKLRNGINWSAMRTLNEGSLSTLLVNVYERQRKDGSGGVAVWAVSSYAGLDIFLHSIMKDASISPNLMLHSPEQIVSYIGRSSSKVSSLVGDTSLSCSQRPQCSCYDGGPQEHMDARNVHRVRWNGSGMASKQMCHNLREVTSAVASILQRAISKY